MLISKVDPFFICKRLYFLWDLGDGRNATGKEVEHYYNNTGVYGVVLKILKVFDDGHELQMVTVTNVTMRIHIKGNVANLSKPNAANRLWGVTGGNWYIGQSKIMKHGALQPNGLICLVVALSFASKIIWQ